MSRIEQTRVPVDAIVAIASQTIGLKVFPMPKYSLTVLVVDDEPLIRDSMSYLLTGMGCKVRCAEDGFAALARIRESKPDILLSDLKMPRMSGFELLDVVRRRFPGIYVIATSGSFSGTDIPDGVAADAFYEKATSLSLLFQIMDRAAQGKREASRRFSMPGASWIASDRIKVSEITEEAACCQ